jgi:hypothetical protein
MVKLVPLSQLRDEMLEKLKQPRPPEEVESLKEKGRLSRQQRLRKLCDELAIVFNSHGYDVTGGYLQQLIDETSLLNFLPKKD